MKNWFSLRCIKKHPKFEISFCVPGKILVTRIIPWDHPRTVAHKLNRQIVAKFDSSAHKFPQIFVLCGAQKLVHRNQTLHTDVHHKLQIG